MDQEVVTELIQDSCTSAQIKIELQRILDPENRTKLLKEYEQLESKLGGAGASKKTAQLIIRSLQPLR
jgi:lipid-A-disaccharide synthase